MISPYNLNDSLNLLNCALADDKLTRFKVLHV